MLRSDTGRLILLSGRRRFEVMAAGVVVFGAALVACSSDDSGVVVPAVEAADVRLEWPSADHTVVSIDLVPVGEDGPVRRLSSSTLFGVGPDSDPFSEGDLLVAAFSTADGIGGLSGEEVDVRGGVGYRDQALADYALPDAVSFFESELAVIVASRSMSFDSLIAIAEDLVVEGQIVTLPSPPLPQLAASDWLAWDRGGDWWVVYEAAPPNEGDAVAVSGRPGGDEESLLRRYVFDGQPVRVRGTDGWVSSGDSTDADARTVHWVENGNVVAVRSTNASPIVIANELVYTDLDRWQEIAMALQDG